MVGSSPPFRKQMGDDQELRYVVIRGRLVSKRGQTEEASELQGCPDGKRHRPRNSHLLKPARLWRDFPL